ncbi:MAG TPA: hypothetical protein PLQ19_10555 [Aeromicrobium sp.]|nr:hypothetical protein [Aeromicrobium sp.]
MTDPEVTNETIRPFEMTGRLDAPNCESGVCALPEPTEEATSSQIESA